MRFPSYEGTRYQTFSVEGPGSMRGILICGAIFVLLGLSVIGLFSMGLESAAYGQSYLSDPACKELAEKTSRDIQKSASCRSVQDCSTVWLGCPFGCGTALRSSEAHRIREAVEQFNKRCPPCKYNCRAQKQELQCVNSLCVLIDT